MVQENSNAIHVYWTDSVIITKTLFSVLILISATLSYFNSLFSPATTKQGFPDGSDSKESASNAGDPGLITGLGRYPGEGNAIHSSILAWRIPWTEDPGRLQYMGSQRVRCSWATNTSLQLAREENILHTLLSQSWGNIPVKLRDFLI